MKIFRSYFTYFGKAFQLITEPSNFMQLDNNKLKNCSKL